MRVVILTLVTVVVIVTYFSKNNLTPQQQMKCSQGSFLQFLRCFFLKLAFQAHIVFELNKKIMKYRTNLSEEKKTKIIFKLKKKNNTSLS